MPAETQSQSPFNDMEPRHASASCNDCQWVAETGSASVLPLVKEHADEHRHDVTAHAYIESDSDAPKIISTVVVPPDADLIRRFLSKPDPTVS